MSAIDDELVDRMAKKHSVSPAAVQVVLAALRSGAAGWPSSTGRMEPARHAGPLPISDGTYIHQSRSTAGKLIDTEMIARSKYDQFLWPASVRDDPCHPSRFSFRCPQCVSLRD